MGRRAKQAIEELSPMEEQEIEEIAEEITDNVLGGRKTRPRKKIELPRPYTEVEKKAVFYYIGFLEDEIDKAEKALELLKNDHRALIISMQERGQTDETDLGV